MDCHDGKIEVSCQHGYQECYGNQLHACALKYISNYTRALQFNACLMDFNYDLGSNDMAVQGVSLYYIVLCAVPTEIYTITHSTACMQNFAERQCSHFVFLISTTIFIAKYLLRQGS